MPSVSELMLAGGCANNIDAVHGEPVQILTGPDAGKPGFRAVIEVEPDQGLLTDLSIDKRAKIVLRFLGAGPQLGMTGRIKRDSGKVYQANSRDEADFLTTDYELTELVKDKDKDY